MNMQMNSLDLTSATTLPVQLTTLDDALDAVLEFCDILTQLTRTDLVLLHQILLIETEQEQKLYIRQVRNSTTFDGTLYNAYCARVLVVNPVDYVKDEIMSRMT
jgi:hypothetical protein